MTLFKTSLPVLLLIIYPFILFAQTSPNGSADKDIQVLELRNYLLKPGQRENFTRLFEANFIQSQQEAGSYVLGQYKVKGADNNFFWIRGFTNMTTRNKALNEFYHGETWKQHRSEANAMIVNNDNVYLLKPVNVKDSTNEVSFNTNWFGQQKAIVVIDFYTSNTKRDKLIEFIRKQYNPILQDSHISRTSFWMSETATNDFPGLPVFQDKNLLVQITLYKDQLEYQTKMKTVNTKMTAEQKAEMADLVTIKNTLIVYPTNKSFRIP